MSRRDFLKTAAITARGLAIFLVPAGAIQLAGRCADTLIPSRKRAKRYVFLFDATKCIGCGMCVQACKLENDVPLETDVSRTWVERYVVTRDGAVHADSPHAGRDGFTTSRIDEGEGHLRTINDADIEKAFFIPKTCNHCDNPPCVQVCPVGATYQTEEGVVLVDRSTCIGCAYCVMACPYGARFFHPVTKTAEKCTLCYHRLAKGLKPACEEACPEGVRRIGNLEDPNDPVTRTIREDRVGVLKDEYGCNPQVYYLGLSREVR
jgi:Fe-S-cluster-containing dehydrogenase component